jgi:DNA-directed RNA polymerase I, II, and III subunit RPABC5
MIANKWNDYCRLINEERRTPLEALELLGIRRYCCRRMQLTHVDLIDKMLPYSRTDVPDDAATETA